MIASLATFIVVVSIAVTSNKLQLEYDIQPNIESNSENILLLEEEVDVLKKQQIKLEKLHEDTI